MMEEKGLTQAEAAKNAGVSQQTVSNWLSGTAPNAVNLSNFGMANGVSESYFFNPIEVTPGSKKSMYTDIGSDVASEKSPKKVVDYVYSSVNIERVRPLLPELIERLKKATGERGKKTALAQFLDVPLAMVSQWLSGDREPGGETTLRMLQWVEQQERQK